MQGPSWTLFQSDVGQSGKYLGNSGEGELMLDLDRQLPPRLCRTRRVAVSQIQSIYRVAVRPHVAPLPSPSPSPGAEPLLGHPVAQEQVRRLVQPAAPKRWDMSSAGDSRRCWSRRDVHAARRPLRGAQSGAREDGRHSRGVPVVELSGDGGARSRTRVERTNCSRR